jgi:hypothetical protein
MVRHGTGVGAAGGLTVLLTMVCRVREMRCQEGEEAKTRIGSGGRAWRTLTAPVAKEQLQQPERQLRGGSPQPARASDVWSFLDKARAPGQETWRRSCRSAGLPVGDADVMRLDSGSLIWESLSSPGSLNLTRHIRISIRN